MFLDDAGVLHRHKPAGEGNHLRAEPHVLIVKGRFFMRDLGHRAKVTAALLMRKGGSASPKTMNPSR
jgi:hypothetical protein